MCVCVCVVVVVVVVVVVLSKTAKKAKEGTSEQSSEVDVRRRQIFTCPQSKFTFRESSA